MKRTHMTTLLVVALMLSLPVLAACGESASSHLQQGNELTRAGEYAQAVEEYEAALKLEPENVDVLTNLGVVLYQLGQPSLAIESYNKAVALAPGDADIRSNLAAAYVQLYEPGGATDSLDMALEQYQKAIELQPNLAEAHYGTGVVYYLQGQIDQAIAAFVKFQEMDTGTDQQATQNAEAILQELRGQ